MLNRAKHRPFRLIELLNSVEWKYKEWRFRKGKPDCLYPCVKRFGVDPFYEGLACKGLINPYLLARAHSAWDNQAYYQKLRRIFAEDPSMKRYLLKTRALFPKKPFYLLLHPCAYQSSARDLGELRKLGFVFRAPRWSEGGSRMR